MESDSLVTAAFLCGWACADEAHVGVLPESLVTCLGLDSAELSVLRDGERESTRQVYPPGSEMASDAEKELLMSFESSLGGEGKVKLAASSKGNSEIAAQQGAILRQIARLGQKALECVMVRQHDRRALGHPFDLLSEREWQVCRALEGPESEKRISVELNCSTSTVHTHVRRIYEKLKVRGRKELVDLLRQAREAYRLQAARQFRP